MADVKMEDLVQVPPATPMKETTLVDENRKPQYEQLCSALNADEDSQTQGWALYQRVHRAISISSEQERFFFACALYLGSRVLEDPTKRHQGLPLSQLLRESRIRLVDFLEPLKQFVHHLGDPQYVQLSKTLEKKYVIVSILFQKYVKIFAEIIAWEPTPEAIELNRREKQPHDGYLIFSLCWNIFILAKAKLLGDAADLVDGFHLLLCVAHLLIVHTSQANGLRRVSLTKAPFDARSEPLLTCVAKRYKANPAELEKMEQTFAEFLSSINKTGPLRLHFNSAHLPTDPQLLSIPNRFPAMLEGLYLKANDASFNDMYNRHFLASGEFDERLFVSDFETQIGSPSRLSSQSRSLYSVRGPFSPVPQTPVAIALDSSNWLERFLGKDHTAAPSAALQQFYAAATTTKTPNIGAKITEWTTNMATKTSRLLTQPLAMRIVAFHYCLLETILKAEQARLKRDNFSALLESEKFHSALFFLAQQIVTFVSKQGVAFTIADSIATTSAGAFEVVKIAESVFRALGPLVEFPRGLQQHLQHTVDQLLEARAWELQPSDVEKTTSSDVTTEIPAEPKPKTVTIFDMMRFDNIKFIKDPVKAKEHLLYSLLQVHQSPPSSALPQDIAWLRGSGLENFFKHVVRLASVRVADLCKPDEKKEKEPAFAPVLSIQPPLPHLILAALVTILVYHTDILAGRHLDHIILCVIYGVCRVNKVPNVTFKAMIEKYNRPGGSATRPSCSFKEVPLDPPTERGDIIKFYNEIFVVQLDRVIMQFDLASAHRAEANSIGAIAAAAASGNQPSVIGFSPFKSLQSPSKVVGNVYLSPQRSLAATGTPSVGRVAEFSFGESPQRTLHSINTVVKGRSNLRKRLFMDANSYEEDKRARSGALDLVSLADAAENFSMNASSEAVERGSGESSRTESSEGK